MNDKDVLKTNDADAPREERGGNDVPEGEEV